MDVDYPMPCGARMYWSKQLLSAVTLPPPPKTAIGFEYATSGIGNVGKVCMKPVLHPQGGGLNSRNPEGYPTHMRREPGWIVGIAACGPVASG